MLKKIIRLFSRNDPSENNHDLKNVSECYSINLSENARSAERLKKIGDEYFKDRDLIQAENYYKQSLEIDPSQFEVYKNLGVSHYYQKRLEQAIKCYDQALELNMDYPEALSNRGLALIDLKRYEEALVSLDRAISIKPDFAFAYNNRGIALKSLKRLEEALKDYDYAIELKPDFAEAYNNRGSALNSLRKPDEALVSLDNAIAIKPNYVEAYCNRGGALRGLAKLEDALISQAKAITINPNFPEAHYQHGSVLCALNRKQEALISFSRAIELKPDYAEAYKDRGFALKDLKNLIDALADFERAIELDSDIELGYGVCCETKQLLCEWSDYDGYLDRIEECFKRNKIVAEPLLILWLTSSPALVKKLIVTHTEPTYVAVKDTLPPIGQYLKHQKIRVGYFSGEFYKHAVALLTAELFEQHDRAKVEIFAFSFSKVKDEMTERLKQSFDRYIDVSKLTNLEVTKMARELEIDIAVDLGGFTGEGSTEVFAMRAAPIQINYIGYPGTMGAKYMDYIIADATIIPGSHQEYYTEKVIYLPSFQVNDTKRAISEKIFTKKELELPLTGFVFCCFNNITKINPQIFSSWMRILKRVDGSVLWMVFESDIAAKNLRKEAELRGVDSRRLVFAKRVDLADYLARYRVADLFLDTLPYNAGTTASDALWAGLPVLTQIGETFAGRMAASLLNAIHLPELITHTSQEYEALAVDLAMNPEKLVKIKQKLADNRLTTPLFDIEYFTRHLEDAYREAYKRHQAGLAPNHIYTDKKLKKGK